MKQIQARNRIRLKISLRKLKPVFRAVLGAALFFLVYGVITGMDSRVRLSASYQFINELQDFEALIPEIQNLDPADFQAIGEQQVLVSQPGQMLILSVDFDPALLDEADPYWLYLQLDPMQHPYIMVYEETLLHVSGEFGDFYRSGNDTLQTLYIGEHARSARGPIYLAVYSDSEYFRLPECWLLMDRAALRFHSFLSFSNNELYFYFALVSLFFGFYYLTHYLNEGGRREDLDFSHFSLFIALYFARIAFIPVWPSALLSYSITKSLLIPAVLSLTGLTLRFAGISVPKVLERSVWFACVVLVVIFSVLPSNLYEAEFIYTRMLILIAMMLALYLVLLVHVYRKHWRSMQRIMGGTLFAVFLISHDIYFMLTGGVAPVWLQGVGIFIFGLSVFNNLADRNTRLRIELQNHNQQAERMVHLRTVELNDANRELRIANEAKTRFLAVMSHEMRTPLNCIIGFSEQLKLQLLDREDGKLMDSILFESRQLMHLINQVLDISRIERGMMHIEPQVFNMHELQKSLCAELQALKRGSDVVCNCHFDPNMPKFLRGDRFRLQQILLNLLGNAAKFTKDGSIVFTSHIQGSRDADVLIRFEVRDTGVGIEKERQDEIFKEFVQADSSITRNFGGSGLGLSIIKTLVSLMHGVLHVESEPGKGSVFSVDLPMAIADESDISTVADAAMPAGELSRNLKGLKMLLVDDYPPNLEVLHYILQSSKAELHDAHSGFEAVALCGQESFDCILMDVHMPDMDGHQATAQIRKISGYEDVPVIGISADVYASLSSQDPDSHFQDLLSKPLNKKLLFNRLESLGLGKRTESPMTVDPVYPEWNLLPLEVLKELQHGFIQQSSGDIEKIIDAAQEGNLEILHSISHKLRGGALNIHEMTLASALQKIEYQAKGGTLPDEQTLDELQSVFSRFRSKIENDS